MFCYSSLNSIITLYRDFIVCDTPILTIKIAIKAHKIDTVT